MRCIIARGGATEGCDQSQSRMRAPVRGQERVGKTVETAIYYCWVIIALVSFWMSKQVGLGVSVLWRAAGTSAKDQAG